MAIRGGLAKVVVHLKKTVEMKDQVIKVLVEKMAMQGVEPMLVNDYCKMLDEKAMKVQ